MSDSTVPKANLKQYRKVGKKWQFVPVVKGNGKPNPNLVLIDGEPTSFKGGGKFYIDTARMANASKNLADDDAGGRQRESFWAEASVVIAAAVSVLGTIGAIYFSDTVSHLKEVDLATYKITAGGKIAEANKEAATANQKA